MARNLRKEKNTDVTYEQVEFEASDQRVAHAFDVLFDETEKYLEQCPQKHKIPQLTAMYN